MLLTDITEKRGIECSPGATSLIVIPSQSFFFDQIPDMSCDQKKKKDTQEEFPPTIKSIL